MLTTVLVSIIGIIVLIAIAFIARAYIRQRNSNALSFELARGVEVANQRGVYEAFSQSKRDDGTTHIMVNVSAERIAQTFLGLGELIRTNGFGIIEIPTGDVMTARLRDRHADYFNDIYHLQNVTFTEFKRSFFKYQEWFVNDGLINFGFVSQEPFDEVFVGAYKIFHIFTQDPAKYVAVLKTRGFKEVNALKTISHNISKKSPGSRESITIEDRFIEDIVRTDLVKQGWFLYESKPAD